MATVTELIARIKDADEKVRTDAWLQAGEVGAGAVKPLAVVMREQDMEVARAAKRAMWQIVRHVGRPDAGNAKKGVVAELDDLLKNDQPRAIRVEVIWMLSEIAGDESVPAIAALLADADLRDDARMALERIPGGASLDALKNGLKAAPVDFKPAIAHSLRARGVEVRKWPSQKLVPTKPTSVKPVTSGPTCPGPSGGESR